MKKILFVAFVFVLSCSTKKTAITAGIDEYKVKDVHGKYIIIPSDTLGELRPEYFAGLKVYLNEIADYHLDFTKNTVINFIDNDPSKHIPNYQVPWDIFYGDLSEELNTIEDCNQLWIKNVRVKNLHYYHGHKIKWLSDKDDIIRSKFFKYNGLNGGYLILKPNGQFYLKVGEYTKLDLLNRYEIVK